VLRGPVVGGKKAILFCFVDDHSRLVTDHRWTYAEDTPSAESALRRGILSRGLPGTVYLDNGSSFVSKQLLRALAILDVRLVHSRPGRPLAWEKIERFLSHRARPVPRRGGSLGDSHLRRARSALGGLSRAGLSLSRALRDPGNAPGDSACWAHR
jgi:transposase InsO family protein